MAGGTLPAVAVSGAWWTNVGGWHASTASGECLSAGWGAEFTHASAGLVHFKRLEVGREHPGPAAARRPYGRRQRRCPRATGHGMAVLLAFLAAACASRSETAPPLPSSEPVEARVHVVERGDTLYGIAWRHGVDYREIAAANGIGPPYLIMPGQRLELPAAVRPSAAGRPKTGASRDEPSRQPPERPETTESAARAGAAIRTERDARDDPEVAEPQPTEVPVGTAAPGRWRWPVPDEPVHGFGAESKFVVYQLDDGAAVRSATGGVVVYAGPGLGGYAHLVIVKADDRHLLAYAVNVPPKVAEGALVRTGDLVARLAGGRDARRFRFEARDGGKPVDPARLIGIGSAR